METLYFNELCHKMKEIWYQMPTSYEGYIKRYDKKKDKALKDLNKIIKKDLQTIKIDSETIDQEVVDCLVKAVKGFAVSIIGMSATSVETIFKEEHFKHSEAFMKRAKELDPSLNREGLFQALRNVWTMHSMQLYLDKPVELTDSVFAYSMLYPLTDNYLDDPTISVQIKTEFNKRFRMKIKTGDGVPETEAEAKIFKMIDLIEGDWNRERYPKVYESLMGILDGQQLSLHQQGLECLYDQDLLSITFYKGGTSVLTDAYLIAGELTTSQENFSFYYGVILQLADDLQDIESDLKANHITMMNAQVKLGYLDSMIHKYLNFIDHFFDEFYATDTENQKALQELSSESIQLLIFEATMKSKRFISSQLFKTVKQGSHFSPKAYKSVERDFDKQLHLILEAY
ncbi:MAG: class 1 isoprenoid biosynthesis enzyme [Clostridiales bacterium]|nr:class 1 isoprenoid biosynthesis enzyme [Clostridiales bacterium]